jgi:dimethylhistidine N-methyltransferase
MDPSSDSFKREVLDGLRQHPKRIPSKFFYDERGSRLFEEITELQEYYLTRTELSILHDHLPEMARAIGPDANVIEFGTGAGVKTHLLLAALDRPARYVPIDISPELLLEASLHLREAFPDLEVTPICADYTSEYVLPQPTTAQIGQTVVFYPGSTIGNFTPDDAAAFLRNIAVHVQTQSHTTAYSSAPLLLIGFDRKKDRATLEAAYNDKPGVTAAFNLNLITRIAKEFESDIDPADFEHVAFFNESQSRIEMHLFARRDRSVMLGNERVDFATGEHIITEYSYKFSPEAFLRVIEQGGFRRERTWTDANSLFDVWLCRLIA